MGSGDHFGAEAEARVLESSMTEHMRRKRVAYEKIMERPRTRKLFVFREATDLHFNPDAYPLAADKDVLHDPLVKKLLAERDAWKERAERARAFTRMRGPQHTDHCNTNFNLFICNCGAKERFEAALADDPPNGGEK